MPQLNEQQPSRVQLTRRCFAGSRWLACLGLTLAAAYWPLASAADPAPKDWVMVPHDKPTFELVMQLVVTCSTPERVAPTEPSKDGLRREVWPILGGRFVGKGIRGTVVAGGGDFPVMRPDGVVVVDALYRLKTDDGVTIIIDDKGLTYAGKHPGEERYRLAPTFIAPQGKYEWLNSHIFVATLVDVPPQLRLAKGPNQNDRLIEVYQVN
jgi:hypothetical protein